MPLDEGWLNQLLAQARTSQAPQSHANGAAAAEPRPYVDWDDALAATTFYGRERETKRVGEWIVDRWGLPAFRYELDQVRDPRAAPRDRRAIADEVTAMARRSASTDRPR